MTTNVDAATDTDPVVTSDPGRPRRLWATGWRRWLFPGIWLIYLAQTASGVNKYSSGVAEVIGYAILPVFCALYLRAMPVGWSGIKPPFWRIYTATVILTAIEAVFAHEDALVMLIYVAVLTMAALGGRGMIVVGLITLVAVVLPRYLPGWPHHYDGNMAVTLPLVALAMYGMFSIVKANRALTEARADVARLAAENERTRIARDLHDLLGHSLTTITVKAGLARRLSEIDPARAAIEIAEVEELTRRSLTQVRAAVSGYRDVTLAGELATSRPVLRAAAIGADLPNNLDDLDPIYDELFGWVLREAVTNVVRHSRATRCWVTVTGTRLEVSDDGRGISCEPGSGLTGLRERVVAVGGAVTAGPRPGGGWHVQVEAPVPADAFCGPTSQELPNNLPVRAAERPVEA